MLRNFAAAVVASTFMACGGQTDVSEASGTLNVGGSMSSAGGYTSISIGATGGNPSATTGGSTSNFTGTAGGSMSASTGGSTAIDWSTFCGGLFYGRVCDVLEQLLNAKSCDIPLQQSPMFGLVQVTLD